MSKWCYKGGQSAFELIYAALLLFSCVSSYMAVPPSRSMATSWASGQSLGFSRQAKDSYEIVPLSQNLSVLYEKYGDIHIASFIEESHVLPEIFQLHLTTSVRANIVFRCGDTGNDGFTVQVHTTSTNITTNLKFDDRIQHAIYSLTGSHSDAQGQNSSKAVDIVILVRDGQIQNGSTINLVSAGSLSTVSHKTMDYDDSHSCGTRSVVRVRGQHPDGACAGRATSCHHQCDRATGSCVCDAGYVVDNNHPHRCLATHHLQFTVPELITTLAVIGASTGTAQDLLAGNFRELVGLGAIHTVTITGEEVLVVTKDNHNETAEYVSRRLRHALSHNDANPLAAFGFGNAEYITIAAPPAIHRVTKRSLCKTVGEEINDAIQKDAQGMLSTTKLPGGLDLSKACVDVDGIVARKGILSLPIRNPHKIVSAAFPKTSLSQLQLMLVVSTTSGSVKTLTGKAAFAHDSQHDLADITFNLANGEASLTGVASDVSVSRLVHGLEPVTRALGTSKTVHVKIIADAHGQQESYTRFLIPSSGSTMSVLLQTTNLLTELNSTQFNVRHIMDTKLVDMEVLFVQRNRATSLRVNGHVRWHGVQGVQLEIMSFNVGTPLGISSFAIKTSGKKTAVKAVEQYFPSAEFLKGQAMSLNRFIVTCSNSQASLLSHPLMSALTEHFDKARPSVFSIAPENVVRSAVSFRADFSPKSHSVEDLALRGNITNSGICFDVISGQLTRALLGHSDALFPEVDTETTRLLRSLRALVNTHVNGFCQKLNKPFTAIVQWKGVLDLFPSWPHFLVLRDLSVAVTVDMTRTPATLSYVGTSATKFGRHPIMVVVTADPLVGLLINTRSMHDGMPVSELTTALKSAAPMAKKVLSHLHLSNAVLNNFSIQILKSQRGSGQGNSLRFHASVSYLKKLSDVSLEVILRDPSSPKRYVAAVVCKDSTTLSDLLRSAITRKNFTNVPLLGDVTLHRACLMSRATETPSSKPLPFSDASLQWPATQTIAGKVLATFSVRHPTHGLSNYIATLSTNMIDIQADGSESSLSMLAQVLLPGNGLHGVALPSGVPTNLDTSKVNRIYIDVEKRRLCLVLAELPGKSYEHVPGMSLEDIHIELWLEKARGITKREAKVVGDVETPGMEHKATVELKGNTASSKARITSGTTIQKLISKFGVTFLPKGPVASKLIKNRIGHLPVSEAAIKTKRTRIKGGGHFSVISLTGTVKLIGMTVPMQILVTSPSVGPKAAVGVFSFKRARLIKILPLISNGDVSKISMLRKLTLDKSALIISSQVVKALPAGFVFNDPNARLDDLTGKKISGIHLAFKKLLRKRPFPFQIDVLDAEQLQIQLGRIPPLTDILNMFSPKITSNSIYKNIAKKFPSIMTILPSKAFSIVIANGGLRFKYGSPNLPAVKGFFTIYHAVVSAELTGTKWGFEVGGTLKVGRLRFNANVKVFHGGSKTIEVKLTTFKKDPSVNDLLQLVSSKSSSLKLLNRVLKLDTWRILDPLVHVSINPSNKEHAVRLVGQPAIGPFKWWKFEVMGSWKDKNLQIGLTQEKISIAGAIKKMTGFDISGLPFGGLLAGPTDVGVVYNRKGGPPPFPFTGSPLSDFEEFVEGLSLFVKWRLPDDCKTDFICKFFKLILGTSTKTISAEGFGTDWLAIAVHFNGKLKLGPVSVYGVKVGFGFPLPQPPGDDGSPPPPSTKVPEFGLLNMNMDVKVRGQADLLFSGSLLLNLKLEIRATFSMKGIYERAFGIPVFSFGGIHAEVAINMACPQCIVTALSLSGELSFGRNCYNGNEDKCVIIGAGFGVDTTDPKGNWLFFATNHLSYRKLLVAIGVPDHPALALIEFVKVRDLEASFSYSGREVQYKNKMHSIKPGLVLKGVFTLLWFLEVKVDIRIKNPYPFPTVIEASVDVKPLSLGPLKFHSSTDSSKGAKLRLNAKHYPKELYLLLDGSLSLTWLGFKRSVFCQIDNTGLYLKTTGSFLIFETSFVIQARFMNIKKPRTFRRFQLKGEFTTMGGMMTDGIEKRLLRFGQKVKKKLDSAVKKAQAIDRKVAAVVKTFTISKARENKARAKLVKAQDKVRKSARKLKSKCRPKKCGWNLVCGIRNVGCAVFRGVVNVGAKVAIAALKLAVKAVEVAAKLSRKFYKAVKDSRIFSRVVGTVRNIWAAKFKVIARIVVKILNFFRIAYVRFDLDLGRVRRIFSLAIGIVFRGRLQKLHLRLDLDNIFKTVLQLFKRFFKKLF